MTSRTCPGSGLDKSFSGSRVTMYQRYLDSQAQASRVVFRVNSTLTMAYAVKAGAGLGVLSCITAARLGGLVRLGPFIDELTLELWILTHPELRNVARVATVYAFFRDEIRKLRPLFLGKEGEGRAPRR